MKQFFTWFTFMKHFLSSSRLFVPRLSVVIFALLLSASQAYGQCPATYTIGCVGGMDVNTFSLPGVGSTSISTISSGCAPGSWANLTNDTVTLSPGGSYTATINSTWSSGAAQVFIDFDDDGDFSSTESVGGMNTVPAAPMTATFSVTIPATAATGNHIMRVMLSGDDFYPMVQGCPSPDPFEIGETHDYVALISTGSSGGCPSVTGLTASSITSTGATISWAAASGSVGYKYVINTSASAPSVSGTFAGGTSVSPTGLTPATVYYAHVRDTCGPSSLSAWTTISFTTTATTGCAPVTGLTASGVTNVSATISWLAITGTPGYQYVINTTASAPIGSGTVIATTSISPSGLTPSTVYYAHVRDTCSPTSLSSWVTISFTTTATAPSCMPVAGLAVSGITTSGAALSWSVTSGVAGYKYVVNTTAAAPAVSGTFSALNSTSVSGLLPGTTYYAHVRDTCGPGNVSVWVTASFKTTGTASVDHSGVQQNDLVSIHPNPAAATVVLTVNGGISGSARLYITDMSGRVHQVLEISAASTAIDISGLPAGMYVCKYADAAENATVRMVKQ